MDRRGLILDARQQGLCCSDQAAHRSGEGRECKPTLIIIPERLAGLPMTEGAVDVIKVGTQPGNGGRLRPPSERRRKPMFKSEDKSRSTFGLGGPSDSGFGPRATRSGPSRMLLPQDHQGHAPPLEFFVHLRPVGQRLRGALVESGRPAAPARHR
jgi:hypothetical protein